MPELPEVHTTAKMLNELISGLKIEATWTSYGGIIHEGKTHIKNKKYFAQFKKQVFGQKINSVSRRGKNVLINLQNGKTILVHMKMTGHLLYGKYTTNNNKLSTTNIPNEWKEEKWLPEENLKSPLWDPYNRFIRLVFSFSNGKNLVLSDVRKFAKVCLIENKKKNELEKLGPEPLEKTFDFKKFKTCLYKRPLWEIKKALMNQELIAGIGNIYSDEILWLSEINPKSKVAKIPEKKLEEMFKATKTVLKKGINFSGDSTSDYRKPDGQRGSFQYHHRAYQRTGEKCSKKNCSGEIKRKQIGGRSGHFCPKHQKLYS